MALPTSLSEVPDLEGINQVAARMNVSFRGFGSMVRNLVRLEHRRSALTSLYDIVPFAGDIDLIHSGHSRETSRIVKALSEAIPLFECFRWSVIDQDSILVRQRAFNAEIPACDVFLSSDPDVGWIDQYNGIEQIRTDNYGYRRNERYHQSPLFNEGKDLELFSTLLYFRVVLESSVRDEFAAMPGYIGDRSALEVIQETTDNRDMIERLKNSNVLRRRLTYLMQALVENCPSTGLAAQLIRQTGLEELLRVAIPDQYELLSPIWNTYNPVFISQTMNGYRQRVPFTIDQLDNEEDADRSFKQTTWAYGTKVELSDQRIIGSVSDIHLRLGNASSLDVTDNGPDEFIHLSIRADREQSVYDNEQDSENLSLILTVRIAESSDQPDLIGIFPVPTICNILEPVGHEQKIQFRVNVKDLFEQISREYRNREEVSVIANFYVVVLEGSVTAEANGLAQSAGVPEEEGVYA